MKFKILFCLLVIILLVTCKSSNLYDYNNYKVVDTIVKTRDSLKFVYSLDSLCLPNLNIWEKIVSNKIVGNSPVFNEYLYKTNNVTYNALIYRKSLYIITATYPHTLNRLKLTNCYGYGL
jgi:hypothetical protein